MTYEWLKEIIRLNRKDTDMLDSAWKEVCEYAGLTDAQLKYTAMLLIESMGKSYIKSMARENELKKKVEALESDIKTLRENPQATSNELTKERLKNGVKIASKPGASKEIIEALRKTGMSYDQIAVKLGISRSTVWRHLKE